jgi:hypothetical protein
MLKQCIAKAITQVLGSSEDTERSTIFTKNTLVGFIEVSRFQVSDLCEVCMQISDTEVTRFRQ